MLERETPMKRFFACAALVLAPLAAPAADHGMPAYLRGHCPIDDASASRIVGQSVHGQPFGHLCMFVQPGGEKSEWIVSTVTTNDLHDPASAVSIARSMFNETGPAPSSARAMFDALPQRSSTRFTPFKPLGGVGERAYLTSFTEDNVTLAYVIALHGDTIVSVAFLPQKLGVAKTLAQAILDKNG